MAVSGDKRKDPDHDLIRVFDEAAEREGFEPSIPVSQYDGLANRWFQPLTHLSGVAIWLISKLQYGGEKNNNQRNFRLQPGPGAA